MASRSIAGASNPLARSFALMTGSALGCGASETFGIPSILLVCAAKNRWQASLLVTRRRPIRIVSSVRPAMPTSDQRATVFVLTLFPLACLGSHSAASANDKSDS